MCIRDRRVAVRETRPLRPHLVHRYGLTQRAEPQVHGIVDQRVPHPAPGDDLRQAGPGRRVLRHARLDQRRQARLHPGQVHRLVHRPVAHAGRGARAERRAPRSRVRERRAQREDVRGGPRLGPEQHLGRGVPRRSGGLAVLGEGRLAHAARDAEVDELGALRAQDDVVRLEVPVRHPVRVDARQPLGEGREQPAAGVRGQTAAPRHGVPERGTRHVLRRQPERRRRQRGVDQVRRVRRPHGAHGLGLPPEPGQCLGVARDLVPDHLDRHQTPAGRAPEVHLPHSSGAEPGQQRVRPDPGGVDVSQGLHWHEPATPTSVPGRRVEREDTA